MADGTIDTSMYAPPQGNSLINALSGYQNLANAGQQNQLMKQQQQMNGLQISQQQAQTYNAKLGLISQELATVYGRDNGNPTRQHVIDGVTNLMSNNPELFDKNFAASVMADMPSDTDVAKNPGAVKSWVLSHAARSDQARAALQPFLPNPTGINTGPNVSYVDTNPISNPGIIGGKVATGLSPEAASTPTAIGGKMGTRGQYVQATQGQGATPGTFTPGAGAPIVGAAKPSPAATPLPEPAASPPTGNVPLPPVRPPEFGGSATAPPAAPPNAPIPVKPAVDPDTSGIPGVQGRTIPVGETETTAGLANAGADQAKVLQVAAEGAPQRRAMLNNLEDTSKQFTSGPMAEGINKGKAIVNEIGSIAGYQPFDPKTIAAQEEFRKQATTLAQQQFAALGGTGTDSQLGSAMHSNPNEALSSYGNQRIIQMLKGNEDALQAKNDAWQAYRKQNGAASYADFQQNWNQHFEPRAFQFVHMSPAERTDLLKNMTPNERSQIAQSLDYAEKNGWIKNGQ